MEEEQSIVVTELAEEKRDMSYAWQAKNEHEAKNLIGWLKDHGITAKAVGKSYFKDWES